MEFHDGNRLIAGDLDGATEDANWALDAGAADSESPVGRYAAALAHLVRGEDENAASLAATLEGQQGFPPGVVGSLAALATGDAAGYDRAIRTLVADFEARDEFLEDVPVADTVLAVQALATERGLAVTLASPMVP